jgi:hypothetical protein
MDRALTNLGGEPAISTKECFMTKVMIGMLAVLGALAMGAAQLFETMPQPTGTTVIGEKPVGPRMGNQAAVVVPRGLTKEQHQVLTKAYLQAKADGHRHPELVQGVILQESKAGGMDSYRVAGNRGDEYYGLGQIKVGAARDVLARWPELWQKYKFQTRTDDELKANLILNPAFNIEITSKYLLLLTRQYGFQGRELLNAYNRGPGGVKAVDDSYHYAIGVEQHVRRINTHWKLNQSGR